MNTPLALTLCLGTGWFLANCPLSAAVPQPLDHPYAPLMILMGGGPLGRPVADADVEWIARSYQFVNGHSGMVARKGDGASSYWAGPSGGRDANGHTIGERIKRVAPGFILSNYRNGSYISQNCPAEAAEVESRFPLAIAVWNTRLKIAEPISANVDIIRVPLFQNPPRAVLPVYPFKVSTTASEFSQTVKQYVGWFRLEDEILRIDQIQTSGGQLELKVRRGVWGTRPTPHAVGTSLLQPVYIGSVRSGADTSLTGIPDSNSPQPGIRYALQQQDTRFHQWLGDKCAEIFKEGYDVAWLDVTAAGWYNNGDAYGYPVNPWDTTSQKLLDENTYREYQQQKVDALFKRFPGGKFFINNVKARSYFKNGEERKFFTGEDGHHPVSGGCMENYADTTDENAWRELVTATLDVVKNNFWTIAWAKGAKRPNPHYLKFAYGTYLMSYEPGARLLFGQGNGVLSKPPAFVYWDLGKPTKRLTTMEDARHPAAAGIYQRDFEKALILVNPTMKTSAAIVLPQKLWDAETRHEVNSVTLPGLSAKILMKLDGNQK